MRKTGALGTLVLACGILVGWAGRGAAARRSQTLIPQFQNAEVTVWKTILAPHEKIGWHRHEHGRVVVALAGGALTIRRQGGGSCQLVLETGKAYWLDADPPGELHGDVNDSDRTLELMVVELER